MRKMSRALNRKVRDNIKSKLMLLQSRRTGLIHDSAHLSFMRDDRRVNELANRAIRLYDRKHNDILGLGFFMFKSLMISLVLPWLLNILKQKALDFAIGTAKAKAMQLLQALIKDILGIKQEGKDETYLTSTAKAIVRNMVAFLSIIGNEIKGNAMLAKNFLFKSVFPKVVAGFNKVKSLVKA